MQSKSSLKRLLFIFGIAGTILFSVIVFFPNSYSTSTAYIIAFFQQARPGLPVNLKIPKINVNADIEYVGLTSKGAVDVPKSVVKAGWFNQGPRPGEKGSSVIVGHFGLKNFVTAVFSDLYKLKKGDKIYVKDDKGVTASFVVRETRNYDPKADATYVFSSKDGKSHLNLITCEGIWNNITKTYSARLVVFADKE
jgi:LPXTG-site transpeptidase (sortase) family protein